MESIKELIKSNKQKKIEARHAKKSVAILQRDIDAI